MAPSFSAILLGKHSVEYFSCHTCGLLKTQEPYWLDEAYQAAIVDTDVGILYRNTENVRLATRLIEILGLFPGKYVDLAGGYGLFARMMRDKGYDCYTKDRYCTNLFAKGFEPSGSMKADMLFTFEVLEHLVDPISFLNDAFNEHKCRTLIFSTEVFEGSIPDQSWWYYTFETGQHITFYQVKTLQMLAKKIGCQLYTLPKSHFLITDRELSSKARHCLAEDFIGRRQLRKIDSITRFSFIAQDHFQAREKITMKTPQQVVKHPNNR